MGFTKVDKRSVERELEYQEAMRPGSVSVSQGSILKSKGPPNEDIFKAVYYLRIDGVWDTSNKVYHDVHEAKVIADQIAREQKVTIFVFQLKLTGAGYVHKVEGEEIRVG